MTVNNLNKKGLRNTFFQFTDLLLVKELNGSQKFYWRPKVVSIWFMPTPVRESDIIRIIKVK